MQHAYEVRRFSRRCAVTDRSLKPGETYYSALIEDEQETKRIDIAADAWIGPPEQAIGWWRAKLVDCSGKGTMAPNEVLLSLLHRWTDDPKQAEMRYVLALLLVRRRVLRLEGSNFLGALHAYDPDEQNEPDPPVETLRLYCPSNDATYEVLAITPTPDRRHEVEASLMQLLHSDAA